MSATTLGAGLDLANNLLTLITPSVTAEQKQTLLDEYKKRISDIQAAADALRADPEFRPNELALGALTNKLLNAAGFAAPGLASIDIAVPLDDYLQLLTVCAALVLVNEQIASK